MHLPEYQPELKELKCLLFCCPQSIEDPDILLLLNISPELQLLRLSSVFVCSVFKIDY